jgi:hypothetical protein
MRVAEKSEKYGELWQKVMAMLKLYRSVYQPLTAKGEIDWLAYGEVLKYVQYNHYLESVRQMKMSKRLAEEEKRTENQEAESERLINDYRLVMRRWNLLLEKKRHAGIMTKADLMGLFEQTRGVFGEVARRAEWRGQAKIKAELAEKLVEIEEQIGKLMSFLWDQAVPMTAEEMTQVLEGWQFEVFVRQFTKLAVQIAQEQRRKESGEQVGPWRQLNNRREVDLQQRPNLTAKSPEQVAQEEWGGVRLSEILEATRAPQTVSAQQLLGRLNQSLEQIDELPKDVVRGFVHSLKGEFENRRKARAKDYSAGWNHWLQKFLLKYERLEWEQKSLQNKAQR